jgi:hypothetical protein
MANLLGYAASCAVLLTFLMRDMVSLRLVAILSNILFVAFAYTQHIHPVLLLHAVLLPVNLWRLTDNQPDWLVRRACDRLVQSLAGVLADLGMRSTQSPVINRSRSEIRS